MSDHDKPFLDDPEDPEMLGEDDMAEDQAGESEALEAAQAEIAALNDKLLRLAAELENTRRRSAREKADAGRYAIANFARDLIGVADNFERAFQAAENGGEGSTEALIDGLKMTEKELLSVLDRHGVRKVAAEREKFDPNLHQAVAQIPHAEIPHGHVVDVAQQGFTIGDRVLRAAMVTVSSGPGKGSGETPPSDSGDEQGDEPGERLDTKF
jgi:molecular chaperone GrpE